MKITFVSYIYPYPDRGYNPGIERVVQELSQELVRQGHEVHVLTTYRNSGTRKHERENGVYLHRVPDARSLLGRPGSAFSLDQVSLNYTITAHDELLESSDVVHAFTPIVWKSFSTPLVAHYHHWDEPEEIVEYLYLPTKHRLWRRCFAVADRVVAVSRYSADDLAERGVAREKIAVVPNGVDTETYHPGPSSMAFEPWDNVLLYVGPLVERKGLRHLINAMPGILGDNPDTGLVLVGSGQRASLEQLAEERGVDERVRFEGFVSDELLPQYYRSADVFVFPSLVEGFGMVLVEAMASGLPVVASRATAIPEVVDDAGILVNPGDPHQIAERVTDVLQDESLQRNLSVEGKRRVRSRFTWDAAARSLQGVYGSVLADD